MPDELVPILLYHSVSDDPPSAVRAFSVSPAVFRAQLDAVVEAGAQALITFDDGFADFVDEALPALEERGLPSALYVATGLLRGRDGMRRTSCSERMLHWSQLRELPSRAVEIGAHSHTHPQLDTLSRRAAKAEVEVPKALLEDELQRPVATFAYPHGYSSPGVRRLVREAGYESAFAVRNALSSPADDRFARARLTVRADTSLEELRGWLAGVGPRVPAREGLRTRGWRMARRSRALVLRRPGYELR